MQKPIIFLLIFSTVLVIPSEASRRKRGLEESQEETQRVFRRLIKHSTKYATSISEYKKCLDTSIKELKRLEEENQPMEVRNGESSFLIPRDVIYKSETLKSMLIANPTSSEQHEEHILDITNLGIPLTREALLTLDRLIRNKLVQIRINNDSDAKDFIDLLRCINFLDMHKRSYPLYSSQDGTYVSKLFVVPFSCIQEFTHWDIINLVKYFTSKNYTDYTEDELLRVNEFFEWPKIQYYNPDYESPKYKLFKGLLRLNSIDSFSLPKDLFDCYGNIGSDSGVLTLSVNKILCTLCTGCIGIIDSQSKKIIPLIHDMKLYTLLSRIDRNTIVCRRSSPCSGLQIVKLTFYNLTADEPKLLQEEVLPNHEFIHVNNNRITLFDREKITVIDEHGSKKEFDFKCGWQPYRNYSSSEKNAPIVLKDNSYLVATDGKLIRISIPEQGDKISHKTVLVLEDEAICAVNQIDDNNFLLKTTTEQEQGKSYAFFTFNIERGRAKRSFKDVPEDFNFIARHENYILIKSKGKISGIKFEIDADGLVSFGKSEEDFLVDLEGNWKVDFNGENLYGFLTDKSVIRIPLKESVVNKVAAASSSNE